MGLHLQRAARSRGSDSTHGWARCFQRSAGPAICGPIRYFEVFLPWSVSRRDWSRGPVRAGQRAELFTSHISTTSPASRGRHRKRIRQLLDSGMEMALSGFLATTMAERPRPGMSSACWASIRSARGAQSTRLEAPSSRAAASRWAMARFSL